MRTKIALLTAVAAFTFSKAQENPDMSSKMKIYSEKIDSIVISEKSKMNDELNVVDEKFRENKISAIEKQQQRTHIALKYEQEINKKIDSQKVDFEDITKELVKNSVMESRDSISLNDHNQVQVGLTGLKMKLNQKSKKSPEDMLHSWDFNASFVGTNYTTKDEPFRFYSKDSEVRTSVYNAFSFSLRYENQIGGFKSPVFYRVGLGLRSDQFRPKYGKVFSQEAQTLAVKDFVKGNLKETKLSISYIYIPVDFRFVLNPKYIEYEGIKYLDNKKNQLSVVAGVYGGGRVGSLIYNRYSTEFSKRITEREKVSHGINDIIFGGKLGIGYAGFNVFVQKDFTPTFNNNAQLKSRYGLQIGVEIANVYF